MALESRAMSLLASHHRRGLATALLLALAGFGATAFGVAANMPDPAALPRHLVTNSVVPLDIDSQIDLLAVHPLELYRSDVTRAGDSVASVLGRLNVSDATAAEFLRSDALCRLLFDGRSGKSIRIRTDASGRLLELTGRFAALDRSRSQSHFSRLRVELVGDRLMSTLETAALAPQIKVGSGVVVSSLFAATDAANIPDTIAGQMAEVLSGDIDFHRELRKGDTFTLVYEALTADGEPITWGGLGGRLVAAEFVNAAQRHSGIWYQDARGKGGYYSFEGRSKRRSFLASPLEFSRVSSGFANRIHPLSGRWQRHRGVDYSAPMGTPVRSVADGVVEFAGWKSGYGKVIELRHGGHRSTLYAHLSRIDVRVGQKVEQGARVGSVGATGWATGPHLHFEFKVAGTPRNPTQIAQWSEAVHLPPAERAEFLAWTRSIQGQLELAQATLHGDVQAE
jgi:murein DD-endopeptidase MepM/ murein hydrolase activator NlpD